MEKRKIKTFHEPLWGDRQTECRFKITKNFINRTINVTCGNVLDIGDENPFGKNLASHFGLNYNHTVCDLDRTVKTSTNIGKYDIVFCFEILEHLINPGLALQYIKKSLKTGGLLYISVPRTPQCLGWNPAHFHEFDRKRFEFLLDKYDLSYKDHEKHTLWHSPKWYLHGIRPFLFRWNIGRNVTHWYCIQI